MLESIGPHRVGIEVGGHTKSWGWALGGGPWAATGPGISTTVVRQQVLGGGVPAFPTHTHAGFAFRNGRGARQLSCRECKGAAAMRCGTPFALPAAQGVAVAASEMRGRVW